MPLVPPELAEFWLGRLEGSLTALQSTPAGLAISALSLLLLAFLVLRWAASVLNFVWVYFLRPGRNLRKYGEWAVITGATDGIGRAYADELARRGLNLVLISRTESKLAEAAAQLEAAHPGVQARWVAADLCKAGPADWQRIGEAIQDLDVGLLVNNAGLSYDHPEYLDEVDATFLADIVAINALAPTMLARLVLPGMRARRRGAVINIGSGVSTVIPASPLLSAYAGTKAYVDALSRSLAAEYARAGVAVQNQSPMFVATKMSKIRRARLDAPSPEAWAVAAARQVGREASFTPYWFHGLQQAVIRLAPAWLVNRKVMSMHQGFRARYYSRMARQQAEEAAAAAGGSEGEEAPKRELRRRK